MLRRPMNRPHPFGSIDFPALPDKPRSTGLTSVLDKGLGPAEAADRVAAAAQWIDVVKLGWATSRLTGGEALAAKVDVYRKAGIRVCTGGTFLEVAHAQDRTDALFAGARELGIEMIEVSNGVHPMSEDEKVGLIERARAAGFKVWSEVGRKDPDEDARMRVDDRIDAIARELDAGAEKVILEARESGTVGIYDRDGKPAAELIQRIVERIGRDRLVFEAPRKTQQLWMIRTLGREVNLANVPIEESIALATLRTGLRGDTFAEMHLSGVDVYLGLGVHGALEARERGGVVVLVDALRASATMITALASGMAAVVPVATPEQCVGEVTAGERGGRKLPHVDHGNSPTELAAAAHHGKTLVLTTTNGVECLRSATGDTTQVLIGSTINRRAVADAATRIARDRGCPITLLMAGRNNQEALEDSLAAGEIVHAIPGARIHGQLPPSSAGLEADFFASAAGKNLVQLGYGDDVSFCARLDVFDIVPVYTDGRVVPLDETSAS